MIDKFNRIKLFVYEHKKRIIVISSLFLIVLLSITTLFFLKRDKYKTDTVTYQNFQEEEVLEEESNKEIEEELTYYFIDIKGSVNNPGVYSLEKGKRVVDAINKAGGLKNDANTSLLNLSLELQDEMVIIVYSNQEITNYNQKKEETKTEETKTEEICKEEIVNDACICNSETPITGTGEDLEDKKDESTLEESSKLININKATQEELMNIPGIGESKAKAIITYREESGSFKTIEDIKNVSGIGDKLFESIKEYITI